MNRYLCGSIIDSPQIVSGEFDFSRPEVLAMAGALLLERTEWQLQRRYMQLEAMNAVSDNQTAGFQRYQLVATSSGSQFIHHVLGRNPVGEAGNGVARIA